IVNRITPFRIVVYYLLFSGSWILFSDLLLLKITANTSIYSVLSIAKGYMFLLVTGSLLYWLINHYDLQQRQAKEDRDKLQAQLFQAQKMEAIGLIAGGIAHDFNNILSAMIGYITLIQMKSKPEDPARHYLDQLLSLTERG